MLPSVGRMSPATMRRSELLPAPLGPVSTRASPAATEKLILAKTRRPPRMQVRSRPERFIATFPYGPPQAGRPPIRARYEALFEASLGRRLLFLQSRLVQNYRAYGRTGKMSL